MLRLFRLLADYVERPRKAESRDGQDDVVQVCSQENLISSLRPESVTDQGRDPSARCTQVRGEAKGVADWSERVTLIPT